jgi:hypothetical protein
LILRRQTANPASGSQKQREREGGKTSVRLTSKERDTHTKDREEEAHNHKGPKSLLASGKALGRKKTTTHYYYCLCFPVCARG